MRLLETIKEHSENNSKLLMGSSGLRMFFVNLLLIMSTTSYAAAGDPIDKIKEGVKSVLGLIMGIAFIAGVIICMYGAKKKIDGEPGAYYAIVGGALLAMAPLIMGALYFAFGFEDLATTEAKW